VNDGPVIVRFLRFLILICGLLGCRLCAEENAPQISAELVPQASKAKAQFAQGDFAGAEKTYRDMLEVAPDNLSLLSNLGVVLFREGKLKLAEETFEKVLAQAPENELALCTVGIVHYDAGRYDRAEEALRKATALNLRDPTAHNYLGLTLHQQGKRDEAVKELEAAVALDDKYGDAHFHLAVVLATTKLVDLEKARQHYDRAVKLGAERDLALEKLMGSSDATGGSAR